jgi:pimeloyl-ACP methyl ester carboxylesterase
MLYVFRRLIGAIAALLVLGILWNVVAAQIQFHRGEIAVATDVSVSGASLFVEVHAAKASAPLMLWLHGGPGGAERPLFRYFNRDLENALVVAYYDQRGAGRSYDASADPRELTISRHVEDLNKIVDHLLRKFNRRRIILVGHSWGGALGLLYAKSHPEKVGLLVCVAPLVSFEEQIKREYGYDLATARSRSDSYATGELSRIGKPPYMSMAPVNALQRVTERYRGVQYRHLNHALIVLDGFARGLVTPWELVQIIRGLHATQAAMYDELRNLDLRKTVPEVNTSVAYFLGRHDYHVDAELAASYLATLKAPSKQLVWFEVAAHDVPFDEPALFSARLREVVSTSPIWPAINR